MSRSQSASISGTGSRSSCWSSAAVAMPGIGPWTADYVRMRVLGDPDVLLPGDVAMRAGAVSSGLSGEPRALTAWAERAAPWRSYLTAHLWRAAPARRVTRADRPTRAARPATSNTVRDPQEKTP